MTRKTLSLLAALTAAAVFASACAAQDVITLRSGAKISGQVTDHDEDGITVKSGGAKKQYKWEQLTPLCCYELLRQFIEPASAKAHFLLGQHCVMSGLIEQAKNEYRRARELDTSYAGPVEKALALIEESPEKAKTKITEIAPPEESKEKERPPGEKVGGVKSPSEEPVVNQEEYLEKERLDGKKANDKLGTNLKTSETAHFIIHSDFSSPADMSQIRKWCETLYERHCATLDVKPGDKLWNGKCEIYLFLNRSDFIAFAKTFDHFPEAKLSGGYFASGGRNCRIVIPRTDLRGDRSGQKDTFLFTLLHEGSHAFLQLHGNVVDIKPWLHEGFAQYFQFALPKGSAPERDRYFRLVKKLTAKSSFTRFNELRALDQLLGDDYEGYALSWSIVDYMITSDKTHKKFAQFIRLIKQGKDEAGAVKEPSGQTPEEREAWAMKEAFGQTPEQLEQSWLKYIRALR